MFTTEDIIRLHNFVFLYVFNRYAHGNANELANQLHVSKKEVAGWLSQIDEGGTTYIGTGRVVLLCALRHWSVDEILSAYRASMAVNHAPLCPYSENARVLHEEFMRQLQSGMGITLKSMLVEKSEPLLDFLIETFCQHRDKPCVCKRQIQYDTKGKEFCFEECPCAKIIKALIEVSETFSE